MDLVQACLVGATVVGGAYLLHQGLRWMDRRGWIFYDSEHTAPIGSRTANALLEWETLFNPPAEHVLEYRRHGDLWVQETEQDR